MPDPKIVRKSLRKKRERTFKTVPWPGKRLPPEVRKTYGPARRIVMRCCVKDCFKDGFSGVVMKKKKKKEARGMVGVGTEQPTDGEEGEEMGGNEDEGEDFEGYYEGRELEGYYEGNEEEEGNRVSEEDLGEDIFESYDEDLEDLHEEENENSGFFAFR